MPVSWLDIAGTGTGPGSYNYNVAAYPGGAQIFVNSTTGKDDPRRLMNIGSSSVTQARQAQGPIGDPTAPLASIFGVNGAIAYCKAGRGDTIIVSPGHTENIAVAGATTIPAGTTIVGGGYGAGRPVITFTNAGAFISGGGAGVQLQNLIFDLSGVAALTKGFLINTGGFQINLCKIIQASVANQAVDAIILAAGGDDCLINTTEFDSELAAGTRAISNPVVNTIHRFTLLNSFLHGSWSNSITSLLSVLSDGLLIEYNTFRQSNAVKTVWAFAAANTQLALFSNNDLFSTAALHTDFITGPPGTGVGFLQNFGSSSAAGMTNKSGILIPDIGTIP